MCSSTELTASFSFHFETGIVAVPSGVRLLVLDLYTNPTPPLRASEWVQPGVAQGALAWLSGDESQVQSTPGVPDALTSPSGPPGPHRAPTTSVLGPGILAVSPGSETQGKHPGRLDPNWTSGFPPAAQQVGQKPLERSHDPPPQSRRGRACPLTGARSGAGCGCVAEAPRSAPSSVPQRCGAGAWRQAPWVAMATRWWGQGSVWCGGKDGCLSRGTRLHPRIRR